MTRGPVIAIDGPAAAGKGTLARRIAAQLGLPYLDTGLLYRAVGRLVLDAGGDPGRPGGGRGGGAPTAPRRPRARRPAGPVADAAAAAVAAIPACAPRCWISSATSRRDRGAVLDGRDIGTVIFPDAPVKLYVTASLAARAHRRWSELQAKGIAADPATVEADMLARDTRDAPNMRRGGGRELVDTTDLDADAAFAARWRSSADRCRHVRDRPDPPGRHAVPRLAWANAAYLSARPRLRVLLAAPQPGPRDCPRASRVSARHAHTNGSSRVQARNHP